MALLEELAVWEGPIVATGVEQMALDETLLRLATAPTLRVYDWTRAEVTFGYPQRIADARAFAGTRPVTRRCTGGGFVEHGDDVTLALALPAAHPLARRSPAELYRALHRAVAAATGLRLADGSDLRSGTACFSAPVAADVMDHDGRKVLGGALRRSREGVLYQGSWRGAGGVDFGRILAVRRYNWNPPEPWAGIFAALVRTRYGSASWNERR